MKKSYPARKSILLKIMITASFFLFIGFCTFLLKKQMAQKDLLHYSQNYINLIINELDKELNQTKNSVEKLKDFIISNIENENIPKILTVQEYTLKKSKHLDGLLIAFEKDFLTNYKGLYSPYIRRENGEYLHLQVSDSYDYTKDTTGTEWYQQPVKNKKAEWIGPIYGKAGGRKLFMYCSPIEYKGEIIGLVAACYNTMEIYQFIQNHGAGRIGFPYLVNQKGEFVAHPFNDTRNLIQVALDNDNETLKELSKDIYRLSFTGKTYYHTNTVTNQKCWEIIKPLENVSLFLGISVNDNQIFGNPSYRNNKRKEIIISSFIVSFILLFFLFLITFKTDIIQRKLLIAVAFSSLICVLEIIVIFIFSIYFPVININKGEDLNNKRKKKEIIAQYHETSRDSISKVLNRWNYAMILDSFGLEDYLTQYKNLVANKSKDTVLQVPTGLYLQTIKFKDSHSTDITGYVWQKHPLQWDYDIGIIFPDAETSNITLDDSTTIFNSKGEIVQLFRWYFEVSIREPFNFHHYPIDRNDLWLRMWHKDFDKDIILIPDCNAYNMINPAFSPGLDSEIDMPGWIIEGSFYSYKEKVYNANFGKESYNSKFNFPELHFNVMLHRDFRDPLICKVIPLLVLLFMMYSILFIGGFTEQLNVVIGCSGLFFVAIFEHIHLRQSLNASGIIFLEYLYFITYLLLLFVTYCTMRNDLKVKLGSKKINIITFAKLCFWPLFFSLILLISVYTFY